MQCDHKIKLYIYIMGGLFILLCIIYEYDSKLYKDNVSSSVHDDCDVY